MIVDLSFSLIVHDIDVLRNEAVRMREEAWNDSAEWVAEHGGIENLTADECFYELFFASNLGVRTPLDYGYEMRDWSAYDYR